MNADGSGLANVTNHPADDVRPSWTADGTRILFASDRDGESRVDPETGNVAAIFYEYMMNADGSNPQRLPWLGSEPDWSRNDQIVYGRVTSDTNGIWMRIAVNDPTGSQERIVAASGMAPKWSPDGQQIAFVRYPNGVYDPPGQLWMMGADGSEKRLLWEGSLAIRPVAWSPDGREIAFAGDGDIIAVRVADGQERHVQAGPFRRCPSWSPDGNWLACECKLDICAVHMAASKVVQLTPLVSSYHTDMFPDWTR
jgi:Tol biopolymer transport system component